MMKRTLLYTAMALALCAAPAFAQYGNDHYDQNWQNNENHHWQADENRHWHGHEDRGWERRHWERGERLPREYWERRYVISNWWHYHLRRPPYGYHWVYVDGQYLLVANQTGIVANIIISP